MQQNVYKINGVSCGASIDDLFNMLFWEYSTTAKTNSNTKMLVAKIPFDHLTLISDLFYVDYVPKIEYIFFQLNSMRMIRWKVH